ncbi:MULTISPECIES: LacI family DNA-binding transcriptional regulator [Aerococcus]|uniref:LacI family DNA-binding transcriptional regulator n=1 Tax=Aerococcus urinae (strain CCUG 59500 / ACS-120-V-Col10a) TaxID=2976812 RepID=UPI000200FD4E|nr:LacI family DNA-binding transcriptional regulator [Aerococcus sp. Group 1]AEA01039.1 putative phage tail component domain protein [Aerococcus sp. Group 1]MCY3031164.1 LacI family DNA-binding transcriptional regulator [Aerococcus sp. Group 1]MCY3054199.1 LacI family DNA-binding transcriptional regulator [Aerococcus sp. Group 1]MCY3055929.1 LacI family DNA-binding transcriptional regulator [Aerococcus sp. Group 1]MCY3061923.1 LacI family DNA-binding transcriptional regulator [Aerococcus sp. G
MATMNDVAKLAGVSRGTVSNYINGVKVKEASQIKIQEAIDQLNYVPNNNARALKLNRTNMIAFILPNTLSPFFSELTYYIQQEIESHGFKMLLCNSNNEIAKEIDYIKMVKEQKAAGIITISYSKLPLALIEHIPMVSIEKQISPEVPCVTSDNYQGGYLAVEELAKRGVQSLLIVTRTTENSRINYGQRANGAAHACLDKGIDYEIFSSNKHEKEFLKELLIYTKKTFGKDYKYDGVFTVSDNYADYMNNLFQELSINVPSDIQIVGFDGSKMYQNQTRVISSIRQPVVDIAKESVDIMMDVVKNSQYDNRPTNLVTLPVKFVEGKTTQNLDK